MFDQKKVKKISNHEDRNKKQQLWTTFCLKWNTVEWSIKHAKNKHKWGRCRISSGVRRPRWSCNNGGGGCWNYIVGTCRCPLWRWTLWWWFWSWFHCNFIKTNKQIVIEILQTFGGMVMLDFCTYYVVQWFDKRKYIIVVLSSFNKTIIVL